MAEKAEKTRKTAKTVSLSAETWAIIESRRKSENRTQSGQIEHMIQQAANQ